MYKITVPLFFLVGVAAQLAAQNPGKYAASKIEEQAIGWAGYVGMADYVVATTMNVSDMVSQLNDLCTRMAVLKKQIEVLNELAVNPDFAIHLGASRTAPLTLKIHLITTNVGIYLRAVQALLIAINHRLAIKSSAVVKRVDAESGGVIGEVVDQAVKSTINKVAGKIPGIAESGVGQGISMLPLQKKVGYLSNKQKAIADLQESCNQLNEFTYQAVTHIKAVDKLCDECTGLMNVVRMWCGINSLMLMKETSRLLKSGNDKKIQAIKERQDKIEQLSKDYLEKQKEFTK